MPRSPIQGGPEPGKGWVVYTLRAPGTTSVRYVGSTGNARHRWHAHVSGLLGNHALRAWVEELTAAGQRPEMRIVHRHDSEASARAAEVKLIGSLAKLRAPLLNVAGTEFAPLGVRRRRRCRGCDSNSHDLRNCPLRRRP